MNTPRRSASKNAALSALHRRLAKALSILSPHASTQAATHTQDSRGSPVTPVLPTFTPFSRLLRGTKIDPLASALRAPSSSPSIRAPLFKSHIYQGPEGTLHYKMYTPQTLPEGPVPLIVMLHGCKQTPDDFALGTRMNEVAEEGNFLVMYPAQTPIANSSRCWNWFRTSDQSRGRGEPALIAAATRDVLSNFPANSRRVYIAGLSAGGAAAVVMGDAYPDIYAAVGVHSGLACGAASDVASAFSAMQKGGPNRPRSPKQAVPTIIFHGDRDHIVNAINADQVAAQVIAGIDTHVITDTGQSGGRSFTRTVHSDSSCLPVLEQWIIHGSAHSWSGGSAQGSYTDPQGPDASREMVQFFFKHQTTSETNGR